MTTRPTDELRQAAARLLTLAADVTPGPWAVHNPNGYPQAVFGKDEDVIFAEVLDEIDQPKTHAAYIAAMHPGVGAALADWLESWTGIDLYEAGSLPEDARHALAVARQINAARP